MCSYLWLASKVRLVKVDVGTELKKQEVMSTPVSVTVTTCPLPVSPAAVYGLKLRALPGVPDCWILRARYVLNSSL